MQTETSQQFYLLLGSNLGEPSENLDSAIKELSNYGVILKTSEVYESAPWGNPDQPSYLNQAVLIESSIPAEKFMGVCLEIEKDLGRTRFKKWEARLIDIDIIYVGHEVIQSENLNIPHPHMSERRFVLQPLTEIAPDFIHPVLKRTNRELLLECVDELSVEKLTPQL